MKENKVDPFELDLMQPGEEESSLDPDLVEALRLVVDNVGEPYRTVIEMYFWERCTKAEIGKRFGTTSNLSTRRLIEKSVKKATEALQLYLEVGKVPTASGRKKRPKAVTLRLPSEVRPRRH